MTGTETDAAPSSQKLRQVRNGAHMLRQAHDFGEPVHHDYFQVGAGGTRGPGEADDSQGAGQDVSQNRRVAVACKEKESCHSKNRTRMIFLDFGSHKS